MLRWAHAALTTGYFKLMLMVITASTGFRCKHLQHVFLFSSLIILKAQLLAVSDSHYQWYHVTKYSVNARVKNI